MAWNQIKSAFALMCNRNTDQLKIVLVTLRHYDANQHFYFYDEHLFCYDKQQHFTFPSEMETKGL